MEINEFIKIHIMRNQKGCILTSLWIMFNMKKSCNILKMFIRKRDNGMKSDFEKKLQEIFGETTKITNNIEFNNIRYKAYSNNGFSKLEKDDKHNPDYYLLWDRNKADKNNWCLISSEKLNERNAAKNWMSFEEVKDKITGKLKNEENISSNDFPNLSKLIQSTRNLILYGPPGTGKTRMAKICAAQILTEKDAKNEEDLLNIAEKIIEKNFDKQEYGGKIKIVQFHPGCTYNDFIEKMQSMNDLNNDNADNSKKKYILIIDEINRANVSEVLGELLFGLEYREKNITISISGENLTIPNNLYIIGTMNTADRSLSQIDYAIRRRFLFVKMVAREPKPKDAQPLKQTLKNGYITENNKFFCKTAFCKVKRDI